MPPSRSNPVGSLTGGTRATNRSSPVGFAAISVASLRCSSSKDLGLYRRRASRCSELPANPRSDELFVALARIIHDARGYAPAGGGGARVRLGRRPGRIFAASVRQDGQISVAGSPWHRGSMRGRGSEGLRAPPRGGFMQRWGRQVVRRVRGRRTRAGSSSATSRRCAARSDGRERRP